MLVGYREFAIEKGFLLSISIEPGSLCPGLFFCSLVHRRAPNHAASAALVRTLHARVAPWQVLTRRVAVAGRGAYAIRALPEEKPRLPKKTGPERWIPMRHVKSPASPNCQPTRFQRRWQVPARRLRGGLGALTRSAPCLIFQWPRP